MVANWSQCFYTQARTRATYTHTHTPNRFEEAAEMACPEQSDENMAFSVVFSRCSTAFATKQIKIQLKVYQGLEWAVQQFNTLRPSENWSEKSKFFDTEELFFLQ